MRNPEPASKRQTSQRAQAVLDDPSRGHLRKGIAGILLIGVLALLMSMAVLSIMAAASAYIIGEGHWSKAQLDAAQQLYRYAASGDPDDLAAARERLQIPLGDRAARLALESSPPDIEAARIGFRQGGNAEPDIDKLIALYRYFDWAPYFRDAIRIWRQGDEGILAMQRLADRIEAVQTAGGETNAQQLESLQAAVLEIDQQLRPVELAFSRSLHDGTRRLHFALLAFSAVFLVLMTLLAIAIMRWMQRQVSGSEGRFRMAFHQAVVGMLKLSPDGRVLDANETMAGLLDRDHDSLRHCHLSWLIHADDWPSVHGGSAMVIDWEAHREPAVSRFLRANGDLLWGRWTASHFQPHADEEAQVLMIVEDVSAERALEADMMHQASHDALTGLVNRRRIEQLLQQAIDSARRDRRVHTFCFMDLDQFKLVNDTRGHVVGDQLLCQISRGLPLSLRETDVLGRLGGDEFAILMHDTPVQVGIERAEKLRIELEQAGLGRGELGVAITASIGVVAIDANTSSVDWLLRAADSACYLAKDEGRNRVHLYHESDVALTRRRSEMEWVAEIRSAIDQDRLLLYAQRFDVIDGEDVQYEVLVRLRGEDGRIYSPGAFLPAAERYAQCTSIDRAVLEKLIHTLKAHPSHVARLRRCHVNVSAQSIILPGFREFVVEMLRSSPLDGHQLCFEITETAVVTNLVEARAFIEAVRAEGCQVALDDFGSGLSSFGYLKNLRIDVLKIDQVFVQEIEGSEVDVALVRLICEVGRTLGKKIIAEGAETQGAVRILREIGVDAIQGYAIHRPEPLESVIADSRSSRRAG